MRALFGLLNVTMYELIPVRLSVMEKGGIEGEVAADGLNSLGFIDTTRVAETTRNIKARIIESFNLFL